MSLRRAFLQSPHHAAMAVATVGVGIATGEPLFMIAGAAAYVLGWVYVPDLGFFRRWVEKRAGAAEQSVANQELASFSSRRQELLDSLTPTRRSRYQSLAAVCRDIERTSGAGSDDPRVRRLEELMWTFLRLLTIEESLGTFLESESRENIAGLLHEAEPEVERLRAEVAHLQKQGASLVLDTQERLLNSRAERLEALRKRMERVQQAKANLSLVVAEQERLEQQIKLIRADSVATRNASALSARIDATVEHLEHTNQWLAQMDEFKDLTNDLPQTAARVGFGEPGGPPPLPQRPGQRSRQQQ